MQQLRHPNVVGFYGVSLDGPKGILLMEFCEGARRRPPPAAGVPAGPRNVRARGRRGLSTHACPGWPWPSPC